eukprot:scaffold109_cov252-Pinguiococcus_pyrenoidosus.AAC.109
MKCSAESKRRTWFCNTSPTNKVNLPHVFGLHTPPQAPRQLGATVLRTLTKLDKRRCAWMAEADGVRPWTGTAGVEADRGFGRLLNPRDSCGATTRMVSLRRSGDRCGEARWLKQRTSTGGASAPRHSSSSELRFMDSPIMVGSMLAPAALIFCAFS